MTYHATLTPDDNGSLLVQFPDLPAAITFGMGHADALLRARDALAAALELYIEDRRPLPKAKFKDGHPITLRGITAAKIALHLAMREAKLSKATLAKRLGLHPPQIDRLLDFNHASKLDSLEDALAAVGKLLTVDIKAA